MNYIFGRLSFWTLTTGTLVGIVARLVIYNHV